jgi:hypothetical protein
MVLGFLVHDLDCRTDPCHLRLQSPALLLGSLLRSCLLRMRYWTELVV